MSAGGLGVVVELLGAPASGKSTLATELGRLPGVTLVKDHRRSDLVVLARSVSRSWSVLLAPLPLGVSRARWVAWAGRLGAAPAVVRRRLAGGSTTVVLDQGPAYTLGRMAGVRQAATGASWWCARTEESAALLDLLVVLDADPKTLARRVRARDKVHQAASFDDVQMHSYLAQEQATCRFVADVLARKGVTVLHLDSAQATLETQVSAVAARLAVSAERPAGPQ